MATVQIREPGKCALLHPDSGLHVVPNPGQQFSLDDPLVLAHPWAFGSADEIADEQAAEQAVTSVEIPQPAPPRRRVGRPRKDQSGS